MRIMLKINLLQEMTHLYIIMMIMFWIRGGRVVLEALIAAVKYTSDDYVEDNPAQRNDQEWKYEDYVEDKPAPRNDPPLHYNGLGQSREVGAEGLSCTRRRSVCGASGFVF